MFLPQRSALADAVVTLLLCKQKKVTFIETIVSKKDVQQKQCIKYIFKSIRQVLQNVWTFMPAAEKNIAELVSMQAKVISVIDLNKILEYTGTRTWKAFQINFSKTKSDFKNNLQKQPYHQAATLYAIAIFLN